MDASTGSKNPAREVVSLGRDLDFVDSSGTTAGGMGKSAQALDSGAYNRHRESRSSLSTSTRGHDEIIFSHDSVVGQCGLCHERRHLRESHLLPAALYKMARDPSYKNPNPVVVAGGRAVATSRQVAERFLCQECEQRFSDHGERYILSQCARPTGEFRVRELLERAVPLGELPKVRMYDADSLLGTHASDYLYFAASVFWRASARAWRENGPRERFSLGSQYDEQFRLYLLDRADFPQNGRLFVHVWSDTISGDAAIGFTTIAPCTSKVDGERRHKFCIPGITFILFLGGRVPERHDSGALNSSGGRFIWVSPFADDSLFRGFGELIRQARSSRSLLRSTKRPSS